MSTAAVPAARITAADPAMSARRLVRDGRGCEGSEEIEESRSNIQITLPTVLAAFGTGLLPGGWTGKV